MQLSTILSAKGEFVATISPDHSIAQLAARLYEHRVGALVVSRDGDTIEGIVSERDVVRALADGPEMLSEPVSSIMTAQVITAPPSTHVDELMHLMTERRVRHIPVIDDDGRMLGIVSIGDVVKMHVDELERERSALMDYITKG
jgi:CBS domain-containing protein